MQPKRVFLVVTLTPECDNRNAGKDGIPIPEFFIVLLHTSPQDELAGYASVHASPLPLLLIDDRKAGKLCKLRRSRGKDASQWQWYVVMIHLKAYNGLETSQSVENISLIVRFLFGRDLPSQFLENSDKEGADA